jgi:hypothetical protein
MKSAVFWDVTLHSLVQVYWYFGGMYCLHLHITKQTKQATSKQQVIAVFVGFLFGLEDGGSTLV